MTNPYLGEVVKACEAMMQEAEDGELIDDHMDDHNETILTLLFMALYGDKVYDWINRVRS